MIWLFKHIIFFLLPPRTVSFDEDTERDMWMLRGGIQEQRQMGGMWRVERLAVQCFEAFCTGTAQINYGFRSSRIRPCVGGFAFVK